MRNVKTNVVKIIFILIGALCVVNPAFSNDSIQKAKKTVNDTAITAAIKMQYTKDGLLNPFDINVETKNGVVVLDGTVDSSKEYQQAIMIAESLYDVIGVDADNLVVKGSKSPLTDAYITAKVKGRLLKNKIIGPKVLKNTDVSIETVDGVVFITGHAKDPAQVKKIIETAKLTEGVKSVNAEIKSQ